MATASYMISCPSCGIGNRIPADKEGGSGRCGSFKWPLPPLYCHPLQMTERTFDQFIGSYAGLVLAEFWEST